MDIKISSAQAIVLLFVCRMFYTVTYSPGAEEIQSSAIILGDVIAVFVTAIILIPLFILMRKGAVIDIIHASSSIAPTFGMIVSIYYLLLLALEQINTVTHFTVFITNAVFPDISAILIIITFVLACMYGAYQGIEGIARAAGIIFVIFIVSILFIVTAAIPNTNWLNLRPLVGDYQRQVISSILDNVSLNIEFVMFLLLFPKVKGSFNRISFWYLTWSEIALLIVGTTTVLVLGEYLTKQVFPFYSIASIIESNVIQRLDAVHMALWVLVSYIKAAVYFYLLNDLAARLLKKQVRKLPLWAFAALVVIGSYLITQNYKSSATVIEKVLGTTIPMLIAVLVIPVILLIAGKGKKIHHENS